MHEFSLCRNIVSLSEQHLTNQDQQVKKVVLVIGELAAIDIESLQFWFPVAVRNTRLAQAHLEVLAEKAQARCHDCQQLFTPKSLHDPCIQCQGYDYDIMAGQAMQLKKIEVI